MLHSAGPSTGLGAWLATGRWRDLIVAGASVCRTGTGYFPIWRGQNRHGRTFCRALASGCGQCLAEGQQLESRPWQSSHPKPSTSRGAHQRMRNFRLPLTDWAGLMLSAPFRSGSRASSYAAHCVCQLARHIAASRHAQSIRDSWPLTDRPIRSRASTSARPVGDPHRERQLRT